MNKQIGAMQLFVSLNVWPVGKVEKPALNKKYETCPKIHLAELTV